MLSLEEKKTGWTPQPRQALFLESPAFESLYGGAKGGGKTDALLAESCRQLTNPNYVGAIFRREMTRLDEIIRRSHRWFDSSGYWNEQKKTWTFPSGAQIKFFHCEHEDDKANHQGKEYQFIGFDQLEEFTQSQYDFIKGACRTSDKTLRCYIRATANPGNVGHAWVKNRFIDKLLPNGQVRWFKLENEIDTEVPRGTPGAQSRAFVSAKIYDNPALMDADPNYILTLQNLPANLRMAFLEGDWDSFQGQFFQEWRRDIHVISYREYKSMASYLPVLRFIACDYGFSAPCAVGWFAVFPDEMIVMYRELYRSGMTYEELMREVLHLTPPEEEIGYLTVDPAIQGDKKHHKEEKDGLARGDSGLDEMERVCSGKFPVLLGDNRRIVGWTQMHEYLRIFENQFKIRTSRLKFTENCYNTIRTIPTLIHDDTDPEDVNTKTEDHCGDMVRYGLMSRIKTPDALKPPPTSVEEFWQRVDRDRERRNNPDFSLQPEENDGRLLGDEGRILS